MSTAGFAPVQKPHISQPWHLEQATQRDIQKSNNTLLVYFQHHLLRNDRQGNNDKSRREAIVRWLEINIDKRRMYECRFI